MKASSLGCILALGVALAALPARAEPACAEAGRVSKLYREAVLGAESEGVQQALISEMVRLTRCLVRQGYLAEPQVPGRFGIVLEALAALRRKPLGLVRDAEIDKRVQLWQAEASVCAAATAGSCSAR
mgnify:CR=1 FL=1